MKKITITVSIAVFVVGLVIGYFVGYSTGETDMLLSKLATKESVTIESLKIQLKEKETEVISNFISGNLNINTGWS